MVTELRKLEELTQISFKGNSIKESKSGDVYLIPSGAVFPDRLKVEKFKKVQSVKGSKKLQEGDVLFNTGGVGTLGRVGYFDLQGDYIPDPFVLVIRFLGKNISSKYVFYLLQTMQAKSQIERKTVGTTGIISIKPRDVLLIQLPFPVDKDGNPDLAEQKRIVTILEEAESLKKKRAEADKKMEELIPALFVKIFGELSLAPKRPLGEFCLITTGNTPPRIHKEYYGRDLEWIKTDNIIERQMYPTVSSEYLSDSGVAIGRTVNINSILMCCIAGSIKSIGNICLTNRRVAFNQQINAITVKDGTDPLFLYWYLKIHKSEVQQLATGVLKFIINKSRLEGFGVPEVPLEQQKKFADIVNDVESQKNRQTTTGPQLSSLFSSLLSRAFAGKL